MKPGRDYIGVAVGAIVFNDRVDDHILPDEGQHWVAATYLGRHIAGEPRSREPEKCAAIGWFALADLPAPLSQITQYNLRSYNKRL